MPIAMKNVRNILVIVVFVFLVFYALYQARRFLSGPHVSITNPDEGALLRNGILVVRGSARNVAEIFLEGRRVFMDENGAFREELLLAPGSSTIEIRARDKFGRTVLEKRTITYQPY